MCEKKNLTINCDVCDTRTMKEEDYANYEAIKLNTDFLIVNGRSKSILSRLPIICNADQTLELADGQQVHFQTINGTFEIAPNAQAQTGTILTVNGVLHILPDAQKALSGYLKILVNGMVRCPKSMESCLPNVSINGTIISYPDDCIVLDSHFQPDKFFPLRAKEHARYYAAKEVILNDPAVNLAMLVQKHVQFITKTLLVSEALLEAAIPLFDETTTFIVIPKGYSLVREDAVLDKALLTKNGAKLFIYGDLTWKEESTALADRLEALTVKGTVFLTQKQADAFHAINAEYDKIEITKGRVLENQLSVKLDQALFESSPEGIHVKNGVQVTLAENISCDTILHDLILENCVHIHCTPQQESAVSVISKNCVHINTGNEDDDEEKDSLCDTLLALSDTKLVNADSYVM